MADNTDWFDDVQAVLDGDAAESVEESAPVLDSTPANDETIAAAEPTDAEAVTESVEESTEPEPVVAEAVTEAVPESAPPAIQWDSPDNPHYERAQRLAQVETLANRLQQQQAEKLAQDRIRSLADDDPQRVTEIQSFMNQAQQPLYHQIQTKEQEVEIAAKLATVTEEAIRLRVPKEMQAEVFAEVERMMKLPGGPDYLRQDIETRQSERSVYDKKIADYEKKIAELQRGTTVAAEVADRVARGADVVESGGGMGQGWETRWNDASNFEEAFDAFASTLPGARTG